MKTIYIILLFSAGIIPVFGQITLTGRDNAPLPGDTSRTREIARVDPGSAGNHIVWDFSALRFTGKTAFRGVKEDTVQPGGAGQALILSEEGFEYSSRFTRDELVENGYHHSTRRMTMAYDDPLVRMKYPFSYGQRYSDRFSGVVMYNGTSRTDVEGTWSVAADGSGTLILPDRILRNVLRLTTVKNSLQQGVCGSTQVTVERHYWYAPGYRSPVMMIGRTESRRGGGEAVVSTSAWINLEQMNRPAVVQGTGMSAEKDSPGIMVFPNPFAEKLTYQYFLRRSMPVKVELYDITGKSVLIAEPMQERGEGLHSGSVDAAALGLSPGIYYLRFTVDRQVVVSKVVKI